MERNEKKTDSIEASVKRLEIQIGQIAEAVQENKKEKFPSQPEQVKAITVLKNGELFDNNVENLIEKDSSYAGISKEDELVDVEITKGGFQKEGRIEPNLGQKEKDKEAFSGPEFYKAAEPYKPPIPFPNRLKESKQDKQFSKIFDMLSKVNINLSLLDVIRNMPAYAKFFKELNSNKRRYGNNEKVLVSETTSAVLQQQLPPKMKDPGSFTVDITMRDKKVAKAMLDLGASINLMPYSTYAQLGLGQLKPTTMSLQLTDRSIKYPRAIVEDLLIQAGKLIIPADFVVLDMEGTSARDNEQTILLGRPFMATTKTVIDMHNGKLIMTVLGETVEFKVFDSLTISPSTSIDEYSPIESKLEIINEPFKVELKELPNTLKYVFLGEKNTYSVIIASYLSPLEEDATIRELRRLKKVIGWGISDIKGISPTMCMHKIILEDNSKAVRDTQ
eukprot:XP_025014626.1 uncharacterized protein LOC112536208 [Ricinus communis]